ncbi:hypothetical protein HYH03_015729 [Edaphochlamys debaryana]|uniref:PDZ domain-containing protein n=1 Tax=Edaphochlamys debaryana TaxID=47281 RepID=A0A835XLA3_9CHLO|nr:hypothetical protein HYH03_015729 [Edaphochlamys debaryana]|eukprot:KAG2485564.1 hypothetical protein HYH03_015729 [Edaphochlamys debaryana]
MVRGSLTSGQALGAGGRRTLGSAPRPHLGPVALTRGPHSDHTSRDASVAALPPASGAPGASDDASGVTRVSFSAGYGGRADGPSRPILDTPSSSGRGTDLAQRMLTSAVAAVASVSLLAGSALVVPGTAVGRPRLTQEEQLTIDIFKKSTPSVVNVTNLAIKRDAFTTNLLELPQGQGSGFIWDTNGHVVTNYHVIQDASDIKVTLSDGEEFSAKVVGVDPDKDIAVLQIGSLGPGPEATGDGAEKPQKLLGGAPEGPGRAQAGPEGGAIESDLAVTTERDKAVPIVAAVPPPTQASKIDAPPLALCSSSADLVVGQKVYAIGNPFGLDHTLTTGVVSGTGREIQSISGRPIQDVIQTDAAINPGNSGGPLLDSGGCLIGINTAIYSPTGANNGVGFAIPVDIVRGSVTQIITYGKVTRPVLGISFAPDQSSEALGIKGILVLSAREGGPAWKAGLQGSKRDEYGRLVLGDIITAVNGSKIKTSSDLYRVLDKSDVGDTLKMTILRENSTLEVDVTLEANTPAEPQAKVPPPKPENPS